MSRKCVFLDRDGTIIAERHYLGDPDQVEIETEVIDALKEFADAGYIFVVISNQSGVARGMITSAQVDLVNQRITNLLQAHGIHLADYYFCAHSVAERCRCRKPGIEMIVQAVQDLDIDLSQSIMIGDKDIDLLTADRAGIPGYLVLTGYGKSHEQWAIDHGYEVYNTMMGVVRRISRSLY